MKTKSRRPEQIIFLSVTVLGALTVIVSLVLACVAWRETGINILRGAYIKMAFAVFLTAIFGLAFKTSRLKEREEKTRGAE